MEYWDLYDRNGNSLHKTQVRGPTNKNEYHVVINVWIKNDDNKIILTKRHPDKPWPNKWECTGGALIAGEDSISGALREVKEEIGIDIKNIRFIERTINDGYSYFRDVYLCNENIKLEETKLQEGEVIDINWFTKEEVKELAKNGEIAEPLNYIAEYIDNGKI
jgi:8-oxo-dGTP pyrophosphatase MutT (NUDIX family)